MTTRICNFYFYIDTYYRVSKKQGDLKINWYNYRVSTETIYSGGGTVRASGSVLEDWTSASKSCIRRFVITEKAPTMLNGR